MKSEHEYAFDVKLNAAVRIKAKTQKEAREKLARLFDAADCQVGGAWFEASLLTTPRSAKIYAIDGEEVR